MANSSTQPSRSSRPRGSLGSKSYQKLHRPNAEAADATDADSTQPQTQPDSQPQSHTSASPAPGRKTTPKSFNNTYNTAKLFEKQINQDTASSSRPSAPSPTATWAESTAPLTPLNVRKPNEAPRHRPQSTVQHPRSAGLLDQRCQVAILPHQDLQPPML
ncbi:uncharacterized protein NFIA_024340 [Aspergillus fischeri NRRL 181]|uniref:Uncharacterized protein n=1 Tax=Neosartorya fischeri (strain ATCC 1020 / DSM 3700 / CBS 544.65 / FGSC A1164 / JCM 1740 / NRRL 181 / WB 181) TaxID=331117 RepID=A1D5K1_NEOFI|nr:uncharacterized protein NFIA_024340 [Aspergillus fischeri NRRL 181]EAW22055.1 hypothetical protein NFIA_024340 [Aspergillus fischeri NRRL 181]